MKMSACCNCPVQLAQPDFNSRAIVDRLFSAIFKDKVSTIAKLLDSGVPVDLSNRVGQTPLFCAAFLVRYEIVKLLLKLGADPNKRCSLSGCTPVHASCWSGHVKVFSALIIAGGDLRLHDQHGKTPRDWALMQPDPELRLPILSAIESFRQAAMRDGDLEHAYSDTGLPTSVLDTSTRSYTNSFTVKLPARLRSTLCAIGLAWNEAADVVGPVGLVHSTGFGKLVFGRGESAAALWPVPLIPESDLVNPDDDTSETDTALNALLPKGVAYRLGPITEMVPRRWIHTHATVRRIRDGYPVDVLVEELQNLSRLRHPGLLLLMGVSPTQHWDSLQLVYEPVMHGSLYHRLHVMGSSMTLLKRLQLLQQVCDALLFLHSRQLLHCSISSHAVHIVSSSRAKIGCLETLCENFSDPRKVFRKVPPSHWDWCMPWMAPEVARGEGPSQLSDVYSFCCVIWEACTGSVPWQQTSPQQIADNWRKQSCQMLPLEGTDIPQHVVSVLRLGLQANPDDRQGMDLHEVYLMLQLQAATVANNQRKNGAAPTGPAADPRPQPPPEPLPGILKHSWHNVRARTKKAVKLPVEVHQEPEENAEEVDVPAMEIPQRDEETQGEGLQSSTEQHVVQETETAEANQEEEEEDVLNVNLASTCDGGPQNNTVDYGFVDSVSERKSGTVSMDYPIKPASHMTERHTSTCYLSSRSPVSSLYGTPVNSPNRDFIKSGNIYSSFGSELRSAVAQPLKLHEGLADFEMWQSRVFARPDLDGACALDPPSPEDPAGNPNMSSTPMSAAEFIACSSAKKEAAKSKKCLVFANDNNEGQFKPFPNQTPTKNMVSSIAAFFNGGPPKPPRRNRAGNQ